MKGDGGRSGGEGQGENDRGRGSGWCCGKVEGMGTGGKEAEREKRWKECFDGRGVAEDGERSGRGELERRGSGPWGGRNILGGDRDRGS